MIAWSTKGLLSESDEDVDRQMMGKSNWRCEAPNRRSAVIVPAPLLVETAFGLDYFIGVFADRPVQEFSHPVTPLHV